MIFQFGNDHEKMKKSNLYLYMTHPGQFSDITQIKDTHWNQDCWFKSMHIEISWKMPKIPPVFQSTEINFNQGPV